MRLLSEAQLESELMAQLAALGYATASDDEIGPDGAKAERSPTTKSCRPTVWRLPSPA